ncbi:MAG: tRNA (adenosine(37)-N6)-dimethylallyltransferase MiaA, partial [Gallionellales bacterium RIFOXYB12_FULL_54_9]
QLAAVDAETAARLSPNDTQRIQRAMEIYRLTGTAMSELFKLQTENSELPYKITSIALIPSDRSVLHQRIAIRFEQMLVDGLLDELRDLRNKYDLYPELPSMRCVGYRQAWQYQEGEISLAELQATGIVATRQLAKRQLTWLRSMPDNIQIDSLLSAHLALVYQVLSRAGIN